MKFQKQRYWVSQNQGSKDSREKKSGRNKERQKNFFTGPVKGWKENIPTKRKIIIMKKWIKEKLQEIRTQKKKEEKSPKFLSKKWM